MQAEIKPVCHKRAEILTDSLLESESVFAILARMNAFRATILVLLALTVGLMFYAFAVLLPARQEQYQMYQTQLKINEYQQRHQEHEARMARLGADADTPEVAAARAAAEAEEKKNEADLTAAEEHSVLASARRRQEAEEAVSATSPVADAPSSLGEITAYLEDCTVVLFRANGATPVNEGLDIAVRRDGYIVCEATVDGRDDESGQYTAAVKQAVFRGAKDPAAEANRKPRPGDEVIVSPFISSRDLRMEGYDVPQSESAAQNALPEVEAVLTPVP